MVSKDLSGLGYLRDDEMSSPSDGQIGGQSEQAMSF